MAESDAKRADAASMSEHGQLQRAPESQPAALAQTNCRPQRDTGQPREATSSPKNKATQQDKRGEEASKDGCKLDEEEILATNAIQASDKTQNANGRLLSSGNSEASLSVKRSVQNRKKWNRRMKIMFCCLGYKKNKDSFADVASIFAEFYSDLNAPSSDIAAGFVLLSKYQAAQRLWVVKNGAEHNLGIDQYLSGIPIRRDTKFLDISTAEDSHLINDLIYYLNYSLAIFGWPLQVIDDPCMLCCIYPYLRLACCCSTGGKIKKNKNKKKIDNNNNNDDDDDKQAARNNIDQKQKQPTLKEKTPETTTAPTKHGAETLEGSTKVSKSIPGRLSEDCDTPTIVLADNCCSCNTASAERRLAEHNYEIIYISYKSSINVVPFLVAADHSKRTIVVAIRGSMSLADMVTDMNGTVDKLPIDNCPDDWLCHRGITRASQYVMSTLLEERILERAFNCRPDLASFDYNLVLCGHSLGAGAAAILGVLLRSRYPALKAYLYSPPGGILSLPVVEYTKQFATGIILGNDTVARLGVAQLERLRYHSLLSLKSAQKSPGSILARALCPTMCFGSNEVEYDPEQSLDLLHGTDGRAFDYNNTKIPFQVQPQVLYVPGKLVHVVKNYSFRSRTRRLWGGPIYQAVWTENTEYDRVMISEGMFFDHLPNNLMHAMKMLFSRTLPGRRETDINETFSLAFNTKLEAEESPDNKDKYFAQTKDRDLNNQKGRQLVGRINASDPCTIYCDNEDDDNNNNNDDDGEHKENLHVVRVKNVIEDDCNNNCDYLNNNNNNDVCAKLYPNLNKIDSKRKQASSLDELPPIRTRSDDISEPHPPPSIKAVDINGNEQD